MVHVCNCSMLNLVSNKFVLRNTLVNQKQRFVLYILYVKSKHTDYKSDC